VQRTAERVRGHVVPAHVADRRLRADGADDALHRGSDLLRAGATTPSAGDWGSGAGEVQQVGEVGVVELERVEDAV
jgi:hypothetical protein